MRVFLLAISDGGGRGNDKGQINKTVSWGRLQLILKAIRMTKQMMQNRLQAPHMEGSKRTVRKQVYFKRAINGLISPQGVNTIQIHFSFFILPAIKSKNIISKQLSDEEKTHFQGISEK